MNLINTVLQDMQNYEFQQKYTRNIKIFHSQLGLCSLIQSFLTKIFILSMQKNSVVISNLVLMMNI
jgi:hypothetical protein